MYCLCSKSIINCFKSVLSNVKHRTYLCKKFRIFYSFLFFSLPNRTHKKTWLSFSKMDHSSSDPKMEGSPHPTHSRPQSSIGSDQDDQQFCLRWNDYQTNLTNVFDQLLQTESFVDVTLTTDEGQSVKCHKVVLSACSPYFQKVK